MESLLHPRAIADTARTLRLARETLAIEAEAVTALAATLGAPFLAAHKLLFEVAENKGRVVVTGMGKSGHIGGKIASTLASTGTPAFFMHPGEASHGDLGMITAGDVVIAISNSGESDEILKILPQLKRRGTPIIAITGRPNSSLASAATVHLDATVSKEACPLNLAPTASTTAALALGDALAVALLDARGFSADDFARSHPGGSLGRKLLTHVSDVMRTGDAVPTVPVGATLADAILEISRKGMGMTAVIDAERRLVGLFTDGDLRRAMARNADPRGTPVDTVMTRNPLAIRPEALAVEAVETMERRKSTQMPVVDAGGRLVGALNIHDLFQAKIL
jgi:arabinose-5-phosphate isomerase